MSYDPVDYLIMATSFLVFFAICTCGPVVACAVYAVLAGN